MSGAPPPSDRRVGIIDVPARRSSLRVNVVANYFGQGWRALMALAFIPVYVHHMGMESYALVGLYTVVVAWLAVLDLGLRPALSREMARFRSGTLDLESVWDVLRSVECVVYPIAAALLVAGILLANWLALEWFKGKQLPADRIALAMVLMGAVVSLQFIEGVYSSVLAGLERQVVLNAIISAAATLRGAGSVAVLLWVAPTIEAFFTWQVIACACSVLTMGVAAYKAVGRPARPPRITAASLRSIWKFSAGMLAIAVLTLSITQIDKILMSHQLPLAQVGYYVLAASLAGALSTLSSPIGAAFYPRFVGLTSQPHQEELASTYHRGAQMVSVAAGSAASMLIIFGERILMVWTGDPALTHHVYPVMCVLALGTLMNAVMNMPYLLQLAHGWTSLTIKVNLGSAVLLIPALLWALPRFGPLGAAAVWAALNTGYVLVQVPLVHRRILRSEKWRWYLQDLALPVCAALAAALACKVLLPPRGNRAGESLTLVLVGGIVLTTALLASNALAPAWRRFLLRASGT